MGKLMHVKLAVSHVSGLRLCGAAWSCGILLSNTNAESGRGPVVMSEEKVPQLCIRTPAP